MFKWYSIEFNLFFELNSNRGIFLKSVPNTLPLFFDVDAYVSIKLVSLLLLDGGLIILFCLLGFKESNESLQSTVLFFLVFFWTWGGKKFWLSFCSGISAKGCISIENSLF